MIAAFHEALLDYKRGHELDLVADGFITHGVSPAGELQRKPAKFRLSVGPSHLRGPLPLISCLMPTKGRLEQVKLAVACYRAQTWPNRELIVIDQNLDGRVAAWIATLQDASIKVYRMPGIREPLGMIRNRAIGLASGTLLCPWDDDDLQHPARLEIAAQALAAAKTPACLLARQTVWTPQLKRVGVRNMRFYCNTVLATRGAGLWYLPLPVGEDMPAIEKLLAEHPAVLLDLPELYLYIVHGGNTCTPDYLEHRWRQATERTEGSGSDGSLAQLARAYPIAAYLSAIAASEAPIVAWPA